MKDDDYDIANHLGIAYFGLLYALPVVSTGVFIYEIFQGNLLLAGVAAIAGIWFFIVKTRSKALKIFKLAYQEETARELEQQPKGAGSTVKYILQRKTYFYLIALLGLQVTVFGALGIYFKNKDDLYFGLCGVVFMSIGYLLICIIDDNEKKDGSLKSEHVQDLKGRKVEIRQHDLCMNCSYRLPPVESAGWQNMKECPACKTPLPMPREFQWVHTEKGDASTTRVHELEQQRLEGELASLRARDLEWQRITNTVTPSQVPAEVALEPDADKKS